MAKQMVASDPDALAVRIRRYVRRSAAAWGDPEPSAGVSLRLAWAITEGRIDAEEVWALIGSMGKAKCSKLGYFLGGYQRLLHQAGIAPDWSPWKRIECSELTQEECWERLCECRAPGELAYAIPVDDGWLFVAGDCDFEFYVVARDGRTLAYSDAGYGAAVGCLRDGLIYAAGPGGTSDWDYAEKWATHIVRYVRVRDGHVFRDAVDHPAPFPWKPER